MIDEEFIDKFISFLKSQTRFSFRLFALVMREGEKDQYDIVLSAKELYSDNVNSYRKIVDELKKFISDEDLFLFSRIAILDLDNEFVKTINKLIKLDVGSKLLVSDSGFSNLNLTFYIKKAYILFSEGT